jgi:hypothetical protein
VCPLVCVELARSLACISRRGKKDVSEIVCESKFFFSSSPLLLHRKHKRNAVGGARRNGSNSQRLVILIHCRVIKAPSEWQMVIYVGMTWCGRFFIESSKAWTGLDWTGLCGAEHTLCDEKITFLALWQIDGN